MNNLTVEQRNDRERLGAYCVMMSPPIISRSCVECFDVIGDGDMAFGVTVTMPININITVWYCAKCHAQITNGVNMDNMVTVTVDKYTITYNPLEWAIERFDTAPHVMICDMATGELLTIARYHALTNAWYNQ